MNRVPLSRLSAALLGATLLPLLLQPTAARSMSLDEACHTFSTKLDTAQASGDLTKARKIYSEGNKRIAKHFNGASCPNVKAP
jgi:hypothetical protein